MRARRKSLGSEWRVRILNHEHDQTEAGISQEGGHHGRDSNDLIPKER